MLFECSFLNPNGAEVMFLQNIKGFNASAQAFRKVMFFFVLLRVGLIIATYLRNLFHFMTFQLISCFIWRCVSLLPTSAQVISHQDARYSSVCVLWRPLLRGAFEEAGKYNKATVAVLQNLVLCQKVLPMNEALANKERSQDTLSLFATRKWGQFPVRSTVDETSQKLVCGFGMIAKKTGYHMLSLRFPATNGLHLPGCAILKGTIFQQFVLFRCYVPFMQAKLQFI